MRQLRFLDRLVINVLCVYHVKSLRTQAKRSDLRAHSINNPDLDARTRRFEDHDSCRSLPAYKEMILELECPRLAEAAAGTETHLNFQTAMFGVGVLAQHVSVGSAVGGAVGAAVGDVASGALTETAGVAVEAVTEGTSSITSGVTNSVVASGAGTMVSTKVPADQRLQRQILGSNGTYNKVKQVWTASSILLITAAVVGDVLSGGLSAGGFTATALTGAMAGSIAFSLTEGVALTMRKRDMMHLRNCFNSICNFAPGDVFHDMSSEVGTVGGANNSETEAGCDCKGGLDWYGSCTNPYGFRFNCRRHAHYGLCTEEKTFWTEEFLCKWTGAH